MAVFLTFVRSLATLVDKPSDRGALHPLKASRCFCNGQASIVCVPGPILGEACISLALLYPPVEAISKTGLKVCRRSFALRLACSEQHPLGHVMRPCRTCRPQVSASFS